MLKRQTQRKTNSQRNVRMYTLAHQYKKRTFVNKHMDIINNSAYKEPAGKL